jgi:hypothetical protein
MSCHPGWRDLAQRIEEEKDPSKVIELAQQLIAMIDEKTAWQESSAGTLKNQFPSR